MEADMKKPDADHSLRGYVLTEEAHEHLQKIRDQLWLLSTFVFAATLEEEDTPMEIRRSKLGQCFEEIGLEIDKVLDTLSWPRRPLRQSVRKH
jgi:hypothetical protein